MRLSRPVSARPSPDPHLGAVAEPPPACAGATSARRGPDLPHPSSSLSSSSPFCGSCPLIGCLRKLWGGGHVTAEQLCDAPGRIPGHDVVLFRSHRIDVLTNAAEINRLAL